MGLRVLPTYQMNTKNTFAFLMNSNQDKGSFYAKTIFNFDLVWTNPELILIRFDANGRLTTPTNFKRKTCISRSQCGRDLMYLDLCGLTKRQCSHLSNCGLPPFTFLYGIMSITSLYNTVGSNSLHRYAQLAGCETLDFILWRDLWRRSLHWG